MPSTEPDAHAAANPLAGQRVRVVLADVASPRRAAHTRDELHEQTRVGEELVRGLVRAQLALSLRSAAIVIIGLGSLPLLFEIAPTIARQRPFGIALPWLLLGICAYPFLFGVGWAYVHLTERIEREFTELVERPEK